MSGQELETITPLLLAQADKAGKNRGLFGAEIGILLHRAVANFRPQDFGAASVRDFIGKRVPQLKIIGRTPSDFIYGLKDWPELPAPQIESEEPTDDDQFWRIWVSPASQYSMAIARDGTRVRAILKGRANSDEIEISPASVQDHQAIARLFLKDRSDALGGLASILEKILDQAPNSWWNEWARTLRDESRDLSRDWMGFRQEALEKALRMKLAELHLEGDAADRVMDATLTARRRWKQRKTSQGVDSSSPLPRSITAPPLKAASRRADVADLVQDLADTSTPTQNRSLIILLGIVLGEFIERPRR
jgi:hypothetical protein